MWRIPHGDWKRFVCLGKQNYLPPYGTFLIVEAGWHPSFMLHFIITFSHVSVVPHLRSREEVYKIPGLLPQLTQHRCSLPLN